MKIAIYGDSHSPGTGGWCYAQSFRDMGHEVLAISDSICLDAYASNLELRLVRKVLGRPLERDRERHAKSVVEEVLKLRPHILIILKGIHIAAKDIKAMRESGAWIAIISHDDFFSKNRNNWSRIQRQALPYYDHIFANCRLN